MASPIRIAIAGYGNLGRGVEAALTQNTDMQLVAVFSRRDPATVTLLSADVPVYPMADIDQYQQQVDVMILCGGSKTDLPEQGPYLAQFFNTVDSFDTHAKVNEYYQALDLPAQKTGHVALLSGGWDPGLFSLNRLYGETILAEGETYTFWGKGLSQGHSDAVRRVPGVKRAVQYTLPSEDAVGRVRSGEQPALTTREKHTRECYVVLTEGADAEVVRNNIVTMPDYFADYDTSVHFIDEAAFDQEHNSMPHGGFVIRSGVTGANSKQTIEYSLALGSNPEFTASVLVAYSRAVHRLACAGDAGAKTVFDIAPGLLSPKDPAQLRKELL
jgi:diaminopimelate dehydrogenase